MSFPTPTARLGAKVSTRLRTRERTTPPNLSALLLPRRRRLNASEREALSAVPYALVLAIILIRIASYFSDRSSRRVAFVWPFLILGGIVFYFSAQIGPASFWLSVLLLIVAGGAMYTPYLRYFALIPELLPRKVSGAAVALINSAGAVGGFVGVYIVGWLIGPTRTEGTAFIVWAAWLVAPALLMLPVREPTPYRILATEHGA